MGRKEQSKEGEETRRVKEQEREEEDKKQTETIQDKRKQVN